MEILCKECNDSGIYLPEFVTVEQGVIEKYCDCELGNILNSLNFYKDNFIRIFAKIRSISEKSEKFQDNIVKIIEEILNDIEVNQEKDVDYEK